MIYKKEEYERDLSKLFIYWIFELLIGGTIMFLGNHFNNNIVVGLGFSICIIAIFLFIGFSTKNEKEYLKNERKY